MSQEHDILVRLFVENRAEEWIAEGIFADFVRNGSLDVRMCWTSSGAISFAQYWLLTSPNVCVAVALNCEGNAEDFRTPIRNILSRAAEEARWHIALAIPDMSKWLLFDPKFAESVTQARLQPTKSDITVHFKDWVSQSGNQFDRDEVAKQNAEFARLNKFIEEHALSTAGTPE
jgi:hypothetical protein